MRYPIYFFGVQHVYIYIPPPPNVPQFPNTQQTYTEPSIVPEDDNSKHQQHHIPGDLTYHKPTDDSAYHITVVLQMLIYSGIV